MSDRIKLRAGTSAQWAASAVALLENEFGYDTDVAALKIGDGATLWAELPWVNMGLRIWGETPTGDMDGVNDTYTLSSAPPGTKWFGFYNTQPLVDGVDGTRSGDTITLTSIRPNSADSDTLIIFC